MLDEKDINDKHKHMLYPTVRVRTTKAGGSGTLIYSKQVPDEEDGIFESYVLTLPYDIVQNVKKGKESLKSLKVLLVWGSKGKRLYMEEFAESLKKLHVECKLVNETDFAKPFQFA